MRQPLVSIICLCYNHAQFIEEAVASVLNQTYKNIEIIIVDDASTDESKEIIKKICASHPVIRFVDLHENVGNCAAFNRGLVLAQGDFIVDFATDDIFLPHRIEKQIEAFSKLPDDYGVTHTNSTIIDEQGQSLYQHKDYLLKNGIINEMPEGEVYSEVLQRYFISPPSMLVKKAVFDELGGYDENLAYEDFDFWVRSSRNWKYHYLDEPLTKVRKTKSSKSAGWYKRGDRQLHSTYLVCKKAKELNQSEKEDIALANRLKFEIRQSVFSENLKEARLFYGLLKELGKVTFLEHVIMFIGKLKLPLAPLRRFYHRLRY